jgi:hypothetical protein
MTMGVARSFGEEVSVICHRTPFVTMVSSDRSFPFYTEMRDSVLATRGNPDQMEVLQRVSSRRIFHWRTPLSALHCVAGDCA